MEHHLAGSTDAAGVFHPGIFSANTYQIIGVLCFTALAFFLIRAARKK
jgi:hypothetical protein